MIVSKRIFLGLMAGFGASAMFPSIAQADGGPLPDWVQSSGLQLYSAGVNGQHDLSLVYFGTPNQLNEVSCGDDLMLLQVTAAELAKQGVLVTPVFVFPDDLVAQSQWDNVRNYIDPQNSVITAYRGSFADIKSSFQDRTLPLVHYIEGDKGVVSHTQYALLLKNDGALLYGKLAGSSFMLASCYAAKAQELDMPDYCKK